MSAIRRSSRLSSAAATPTTTYSAWRKPKISDSDDETENHDMNSIQNTPKSSRKKRETKRKGGRSKEDNVVESPEEVSPSKQSKTERRTKEELLSPTRLLNRLSIDGETEDKTDSIEETQRNMFQNARRVLNNAETNILPGREKELEELRAFFCEHLQESKSGSLYVSGQPGTGKTACLSALLKSEEFANTFVPVFINCTSISTIGSIYKKISTELKLKSNGKTEKDYLAAIIKYLRGKHKMVLMVLDEIDQLCGQKLSVLYTIFEWPTIEDSNLILIGIANSLDLTDRLLVRLNSKCNLKPRLMHFPPYTKQQIVDIFKSRLEQAGVLDIFPTITIQLLAAKVSAISGDVRRALDIGRRVVEIAEQQKTAGEPLNLGEFGITPINQGEPKPVQVGQVMSVLNKVYGASQNLEDDIEESFPLQQKILLCCLMLMLRNEKNKDITVGRLHDVYRRVCSKRNIHAVDQAEFVGCVSLVETRGIIRVIRKKEPRLCKVLLQWDDEEVNGALQDKQLIASILDDTTCLGR